jgi:hypothetical protein
MFKISEKRGICEGEDMRYYSSMLIIFLLGPTVFISSGDGYNDSQT